MRVLGIVFALAFAATGSAYAEKVKANQETRVLNHPGEQGKLVVKVKEGQSMTLLSSKDRWLKVRVQGRTGWVPRSKVEMADPDEITRNTRRRPFVDGRSTHRGFGSEGAPDDRIGADAVGGNDEDSKDTKDSDDKPAAKKPKKPTKDEDADDDKPAAKKPTAKKPTKDEDDDDDKPAAKKPVTKPGAKKPTKDEDDDDDDKPAAKKPAAKPPEKPAAKKPTKDNDDDDDDDKPAAKKPAPAAKKPTKDNDDDDDDKPAAKKPAVKAAAKAKSTDDDDDDDKKPAGKAKGGGDDDDAAAEPKRPKAHVSGKEKVYGERDAASDVEFTAKADDILYPGETKGDWTKVESDDGDEGWILTDKLEVDGGGPGGSHKRAIGINVGLGFGYMSQAMNTVGTKTTAGTDQVPDVYNIGTSVATLSLGGSYYTGLGAKYIVGVDAGYSYSKTAGGGITYMKTVTGVTLSDFTLRGAIGYPTSRPSGLTLVARLGFRYRGYLVDDYGTLAKNPAQIPQETLAAPTLGFGIALPKLTQKLGLQIGLDAILFGASVKQTVGLEDGATPTMSDINLNAGLVYAMNPTMNIVFAYDLDHGSYDFGAPNTGIAMMSKRIHMGTDVQRTDTIHNLSVSIAKGF
jgi:SH3-like domain-containing protein